MTATSSLSIEFESLASSLNTYPNVPLIRTHGDASRLCDDFVTISLRRKNSCIRFMLTVASKTLLTAQGNMKIGCEIIPKTDIAGKTTSAVRDFPCKAYTENDANAKMVSLFEKTLEMHARR